MFFSKSNSYILRKMKNRAIITISIANINPFVM